MNREFLNAWFYKDKQQMRSLIAKMQNEEAKAAQALFDFADTEDEELLQEKSALLFQVFESKVADIDYQVVLLYALSEISFKNRALHEYDRIDHIFSNLDHTKITKHFRALYYLHKNTKHFVDLNTSESIKNLNKAEEYLPEGCERWYKTISKKILHFILYHQPINVVAYVQKLESYPQFEHLSFKPKYFLARHYELQGNPYKAIQIIKSIYEESGASRNKIFYQSYFSILVKLYSLIGDHESGNRELERFLKKFPDYLSTIPGKIFLAERARAQNDSGAIKIYTKELLAKTNISLISRTWVMYLLLTAELLEGAVGPARRILLTLDPKAENPNFYSEWVRLYLLEGDENKAAYYFRKLYKTNETNIFEFMYAYELKYHQILKLKFIINYEDVLEPTALKIENNQTEMKVESTPDNNFVGKSNSVEFVRENIKKYGPLEIPVLITGETGTGKEEVARMLHQQSSNAKEPFIAVNCGGISSTLIETELFGYKKGAYTGAVNDHKGLFEAAGSGTIFLDEISAMPLGLQASLLRVLETMKVRPVGSTELRDVKARVIVATNIRLEKLMEEQKFRSDLYFRLNRLQINLPALRDRKEDIPLLIQHFLKKYRLEGQIRIEDGLMEQMQAYHWPGNVRELKNEVERMIVLAGERNVITSEMISIWGDKYVSKHKTENTSGATISVVGKNHFSAAFSGQNGYEDARLKMLIQLFKEKKHLTRAMVARSLGCALNTAANDLKKLNEQGIIKRMLSTASSRSSYYQIIED